MREPKLSIWLFLHLILALYCILTPDLLCKTSWIDTWHLHIIASYSLHHDQWSNDFLTFLYLLPLELDFRIFFALFLLVLRLWSRFNSLLLCQWCRILFSLPDPKCSILSFKEEISFEIFQISLFWYFLPHNRVVTSLYEPSTHVRMLLCDYHWQHIVRSLGLSGVILHTSLLSILWNNEWASIRVDAVVVLFLTLLDSDLSDVLLLEYSHWVLSIVDWSAIGPAMSWVKGLLLRDLALGHDERFQTIVVCRGILYRWIAWVKLSAVLSQCSIEVITDFLLHLLETYSFRTTHSIDSVSHTLNTTNC